MATAAAYAPEDRPTLLPLPARPTVERAPPSITDASELTTRDFLNALRYHLVLLLTVGTLAALGGAAAGWTLFPARYTTAALLRVASSDPTLMEIKGTGTSKAEFPIYQSTQAALIKSHTIMQRAVRHKDVVNLPMLQGLEDPVAFLQERVLLEFSERSEIMKVTMVGEDPTQISKIVNGLVDAVLTEVQTYKQEKQGNYDKLLRAKSEQEKVLEEVQKSYERFRAPTGDTAAAKAKNARVMRWIMLEGEQTRVRNDLQKAREMLDAARARATAMAQQPAAAAQPGGTVDPDFAELAEKDGAVVKKSDAVARIESYISRYRQLSTTPESEHIKGYEVKLEREKAELEELRRQVGERIRKSQLVRVAAKEPAIAADPIEKMLRDVERLTIEDRQVRETLATFQDVLVEAPVAGPPPEQAMLRIKLEAVQSIVSRLEYQATATKAELEADDRVKLIEKASVPQNREMKKQIAFTGVGGLGGFGLIAGLIVVGELRRKRVYSAQDPVFSKLPLLGRIPEHGFVPPAAGAEPAADDDAGLAFRAAVDRVKTLVLRQLSRKGLKSLLVTSPGPDEGKSILAWNLAAGFARTDYRVLFIDGNLHKPAIHDHLRIPMPVGLAEVLRGEATLAAAVIPTPVTNLFCLAAGSVDGEAQLALDKSAVFRVIERAKKEFDYIVIDSCSLADAVDPLYLAQRVDAAVISLRTFKSRIAPMEQACRRLALLGTPILGAVLTDPTLNGVDV